jgi:hypothetical protein
MVEPWSRRDFVLEFGWRGFERHEVNRSCGEVNDLIVWSFGEAPPSGGVRNEYALLLESLAGGDPRRRDRETETLCDLGLTTRYAGRETMEAKGGREGCRAAECYCVNWRKLNSSRKRSGIP